MRALQHRRSGLLVITLVIAILVGGNLLDVVPTARADDPAASELTDTVAGVPLIGLQAGATQAWPRPLAEAWSTALSVAEHVNPDGLGYPWVDVAAGTLIVSVVNDSGRATIAEWLARGATARGPKPTVLAAPSVPVRIRYVKDSFADLNSTLNDSSHLSRSGLPDSKAVWAGAPDYENNRVVITVDRRSDALVTALATRYGTRRIAVRIDPARPRVVTLSRNADMNPFWGGARILTPQGSGTYCTSGFSWWDNSYSYMLTAGHCGPEGGAYSTPIQFMGNVWPSSHENWSQAVGTEFLTFYPNDHVYRGDISLIQLSGTQSAGRIYRGGYDSGTSSVVKEMWWGAPTPGDRFCTGGHMSGEQCDWVVGSIRGHIDYGGGRIGRGVTSASNQAGGCLMEGDSGGPVYTVRADGHIAAKGIISAIQLFNCSTMYFTDLDLAYYGIPGWLKTE